MYIYTELRICYIDTHCYQLFTDRALIRPMEHARTMDSGLLAAPIDIVKELLLLCLCPLPISYCTL